MRTCRKFMPWPFVWIRQQNELTHTKSGLLSQDNKERPKGTCTHMCFCFHLFIFLSLHSLPPSHLVATNHKSSHQAAPFFMYRLSSTTTLSTNQPIIPVL